MFRYSIISTTCLLYTSLGIEVGGKWYDAPDCAVAFDWTWVYGPIRYKAQVSIQDFSFDVTSEQSSIDQHIDVKPGDKVNVCGYYAYENMNYRSNEICKEIQVEDKEIQLTIPSDKATKAAVSYTHLDVYKRQPSA